MATRAEVSTSLLGRSARITYGLSEAGLEIAAKGGTLSHAGEYGEIVAVYLRSGSLYCALKLDNATAEVQFTNLRIHG